ncbi:MAG: 3-ketoacyl-ACP reductase [Pirellulales bacterium]|nr:3-ketoacyl-ACP reductase [Pirellulales bacterium]
MAGNPVAIVTGASRGIGRAIALRLADLGHAVIVNYVRNADAAATVVRQIENAGGTARSLAGNVAVGDDRSVLVQTALDEFGRLDLLVNNAGITSQERKDLLESTEQSWDAVFDTNLKGPFFLAQLVAKKMIDLIGSGTIDAGKIINVSSISSYTVSTARADYCMSKAAMGMMTQLLAARLAGEEIQVFELCPGVIASDMTAPVAEKYDQLIADGLTPLRRWGQPEDVAQAVAAIVSGNFPFSTGERFNIDGGFHIRRL